MGTYTKEGIGIIQQGEEEDWFEFADGEYIGNADLIEEASGVESPGENVMAAFELEQTPEDDSHCTDIRDAYRKKSGRQYPPVFRVRITVEAEELNEPETAAWWREKQAE